jgi:prophage antirepressor-like protein
MQFSSLHVSGGGEDRISKTKRASKTTKWVLRTVLPRTRSAESLHANTRAFTQNRPRKHNKGAVYRNRILSASFEMRDVNLQQFREAESQFGFNQKRELMIRQWDEKYEFSVSPFRNGWPSKP